MCAFGCNAVYLRRFVGTYRLHLQGPRVIEARTSKAGGKFTFEIHCVVKTVVLMRLQVSVSKNAILKPPKGCPWVVGVAEFMVPPLCVMLCSPATLPSDLSLARSANTDIQWLHDCRICAGGGSRTGGKCRGALHFVTAELVLNAWNSRLQVPSVSYFCCRVLVNSWLVSLLLTHVCDSDDVSDLRPVFFSPYHEIMFR
jgi:hypothetical protein